MLCLVFFIDLFCSKIPVNADMTLCTSAFSLFFPADATESFTDNCAVGIQVNEVRLFYRRLSTSNS